MLNEKYLLEELEVISRIILNAKSSFDVVLFFNDDNHKKSSLINLERISSDFFKFVEMNFLRITIIELFKLYSQNTDDYYSFYCLKNRFNSGKKYADLEISNATIRDIAMTLKQCKNEIEKLRDLRNKVYAHNDQEFKKYLGVLNLQEISTLISASKSIFNRFYSEIFNKHYFFDFPLGTPLDSLDHLFEKIEFFNNNYETIMLQNIHNINPRK
nr:hypothetical protein [uncultured Chryseobacterium sp.]